jgi:DNA-binding XRE family transcriptional regulator
MSSKNLKLKGAIVESGLTYAQLAEKIETTSQTIQNAVNNSNIGLITAVKLCDVLGKSINDMFGDLLIKDKKENN